MKIFPLALLMLLAPRAAFTAQADIYYYHHDYRIMLNMVDAPESLAVSTPAVQIEKIENSLFYSDGRRFVPAESASISAGALRKAT